MLLKLSKIRIMKPIESRQDIHLLVNIFYSKIRKNELLGPIFNAHIEDDMWPEHIKQLTDFWETNLFGVAKFKGNPTQKHIKVDKNSDHTISQLHFGKWLQFWVETVNELFKGDNAEKAIYMARKMATGQYISMWQHKPDHKKH